MKFAKHWIKNSVRIGVTSNQSLNCLLEFYEPNERT